MELGIPDYKDNPLPGILAQIHASGPAFAVLARPSVAAASFNAKGREADHTNALYPDIPPLDISTDDKLLTILSNKVTPGTDESHPRCGEVKFTILCPDEPKHYKKLIKYSCNRSGCPICWQTWASRLAQDVKDRIDGSRIAYERSYKARHVSLSPDYLPFNDTTDECLSWLYKEANRLTKLLGVTGCAVIVHPYRIRKEMNHFVSQGALKDNMNRYTWALKQKNWQDYLYFSPHLHLLTFGNLMDSDEFHTLTGWVYRNHDDNKKHGREGPELAKTVFYLLTHSWTKDNSRVVRYWGDLSNKKLHKIQIDLKIEPVACPTCGSHCIKIDQGADYQYLGNAPNAYRKIPIYIYEKRLKVHVQSGLYGESLKITIIR